MELSQPDPAAQSVPCRPSFETSYRRAKGMAVTGVGEAMELLIDQRNTSHRATATHLYQSIAAALTQIVRCGSRGRPDAQSQPQLRIIRVTRDCILHSLDTQRLGPPYPISGVNWCSAAVFKPFC